MTRRATLRPGSPGRDAAAAAAAASAARSTGTRRTTSAAAAAAAVALASTPIGSARGGWIDPDTPWEKRSTTSLIDGSTYRLVMSDEFNVPNRTFTDGHDPMWTALDKPDDDYSASGGGSLHFYNSSMVTTEDGMLKISSVIGNTEWNRYDAIEKEWKREIKHYKSGMVQSWEKFCFTGGIVELDVVLPGDPHIGGLWPAVWMLGNLGRATYLASTNNIWPWSYDTCDRELQEAQTLSACNRQNHYGLHPFQGRGATEIDIIEAMMGDSNGPLPSTKPHVSLPYVDMTLQVAPGVPNNRPNPGSQPLRNNTISKSGHTELLAQTWYEGLEVKGNTSLNPFFYGTYMSETKKGEPVTRNKNQAFQADAVGSLHQLTRAHFKRPHTFRIEWQPGPGGRLDWFSRGHRRGSESSMDGMEGDGAGDDWIHAFSIKHRSIHNLMGSQIPNEPTYLIINTAISSTWGFPYDTPDWCEKCYDCDNSTCACAFNPGFCNMMRKGDVAMYIDHVRVYQSSDGSAHVGNNHTLGCDPPEYPTREFIKGHEYRYMRNPPYSYKDRGPLKYEIQRGGGECASDADCGGPRPRGNSSGGANAGSYDRDSGNATSEGRGSCVPGAFVRGLFSASKSYAVCQCSGGFTGPHCLAVDHVDDSISVYNLKRGADIFEGMEALRITPFMIGAVIILFLGLVTIIAVHLDLKRKQLINHYAPVETPSLRRPQFKSTDSNHIDLVITGTSVERKPLRS